MYRKEPFQGHLLKRPTFSRAVTEIVIHMPDVISAFSCDEGHHYINTGDTYTLAVFFLFVSYETINEKFKMVHCNKTKVSFFKKENTSSF